MSGVALVHVVGGCGAADEVLRMSGIAQSLRVLRRGRVHRIKDGWVAVDCRFGGKGRPDGRGLGKEESDEGSCTYSQMDLE